MTAPTAPRHHSIDYVEIPVTDMGAARRFYAAAFGWTYNDYGPAYTGIIREGGEAGGLCVDAERAGVRGGPLVILVSDDLDATLAAVTAAGGSVVTPPFDFPGGRRFHFADPSGNELAVWSLPTADTAPGS